MVYGATAREATDDLNVIFFDIGGVDFFDGVLVASDDEGWFVDIEEENVIGDVCFAKKIFFDGEVCLRVI